MRNSTSLLLLLFLGTLLCCAGCASPDTWHTQRTLSGGEIRWKPAFPLIGDLVLVEAYLPSDRPDGSYPDCAIVTPDGQRLDAQNFEFHPKGKKLFWSLRITQPGTWSFGLEENSQNLWSSATIAGKETELKTLDAQELWSGRSSLHTTQQRTIPAKAAP